MKLTVKEAGSIGGRANLEKYGRDAMRERALKAALASKAARDKRRAAGEPMTNIKKPKGDGSLLMAELARVGGRALSEGSTPDEIRERCVKANRASVAARKGRKKAAG